MDIDAADVPDLMHALAERLSEYGFSQRQAVVIATDMLIDAYAQLDGETADDLETVN